MKKTKYPGIIKNGLLYIIHRKAFDQDVAEIGKIRGEFNDARVFVTVEKVYKKRSNPQNSYYWGVLVFMFCQGYFEATGDKISSDEAHEMLKGECSRIEVVNQKTGETRLVIQSTTKKTTVEFEEYMEDCRRFILDWFGMVVPLPNEQMEIFK